MSLSSRWQGSNPVQSFLIALAQKRAGAIAATLLTLVVPQAAYSSVAYAFGQILDAASTEPSRATPWLWTLLGLYVVAAVGWRIEGFVSASLVPRLVLDARERLLTSLHCHSHRFFATSFAGALATKVQNVEVAVESFYRSMRVLAQLGASVATGCVLLLLVHPIIAAAFVVWLVVYVTLTVRWLPALNRAAAAYADARATSFGIVTDRITNMAAVLAFAGEDREDAVLRPVSEAERIAHRRMRVVHQLFIAAQWLCFIVAQGGSIGLGLYLLRRGELTIGALGMLFTAMLRIDWDLWELGAELSTLAGSYGSFAEGVTALYAPIEITDAPGARPLVASSGEVTLSDVRFGYQAERPVFASLSLVIPAGQRLGIVGRSGTGKSTLVNLLLRFYDPQAGAIAIDGQDLRTVSQSSVRRAVAFVPQDTALFHRTVHENVRYGRPEATDAEVDRAAEAACCQEFIAHLPRRYESLVGERGVMLSGGQRQRIAIARAILKGAPILVLDEATSSLDSESEAEIQHALTTAMLGKTVIACAHRLSTLLAMDRIVVLGDGGVAEDGTHDQLLARHGLYWDLWNRQAGGFLQDGSPALEIAS
jgi:ABC-type multidrug transport system fused ATPase/permease subunit